jgi:hypothetical protein
MRVVGERTVWETGEMLAGWVTDFPWLGNIHDAMPEGDVKTEFGEQLVAALLFYVAWAQCEDVVRRFSWRLDQVEYLDSIFVKLLQAIQYAVKKNTRFVSLSIGFTLVLS